MMLSVDFKGYCSVVEPVEDAAASTQLKLLLESTRTAMADMDGSDEELAIPETAIVQVPEDFHVPDFTPPDALPAPQPSQASQDSQIDLVRAYEAECQKQERDDAYNWSRWGGSAQVAPVGKRQRQTTVPSSSTSTSCLPNGGFSQMGPDPYSVGSLSSPPSSAPSQQQQQLQYSPVQQSYSNVQKAKPAPKPAPKPKLKPKPKNSVETRSDEFDDDGFFIQQRYTGENGLLAKGGGGGRWQSRQGNKQPVRRAAKTRAASRTRVPAAAAAAFTVEDDYEDHGDGGEDEDQPDVNQWPPPNLRPGAEKKKKTPQKRTSRSRAGTSSSLSSSRAARADLESGDDSNENEFDADGFFVQKRYTDGGTGSTGGRGGRQHKFDPNLTGRWRQRAGEKPRFILSDGRELTGPAAFKAAQQVRKPEEEARKAKTAQKRKAKAAGAASKKKPAAKKARGSRKKK